MFNRRGKLMKPFRIPPLCLISALAIAAPRVDAQTNALVTQNSPHVAASGDLAPHQAPQSQVKPDPQGKNNHLSFSDALRGHRQEWHDCNWWRQHFTTIVFVSGGYFFLDGCYWYPAWGYDPLSSNYDYDGPIYTYGNLLPDETIANVQMALQQAGYYTESITGSLDVQTRAALAHYQRDQGLPVTGAIDQPTVQSLGLE